MNDYGKDRAGLSRHVASHPFWIRTLLFAILAYFIFGWLCVPVRVAHSGMEPTYQSGRMNFCWRPRYWFSRPHRHDVVFVKVPGARGFLMRRVIALEGERIEIRKGLVYVDGLPLDEPYVGGPCDWTLPSAIVEAESVFVIGDNRSSPSDQVMFGQVSRADISGGPLW